MRELVECYFDGDGESLRRWLSGAKPAAAADEERDRRLETALL